MLDKTQLKDLLKQIKTDQFKIKEDYDVDEILLSMVEHLGDTDPELRDLLIYPTFFNWVIKDHILMNSYKQIFDILLEEKHLLYRIEERNSDSVFKRTFTSLFFAVLIYKHREKNYLNKKELDTLIEQVIEYTEKEKDYRGYVESKGWAHSVAHVADLIDELALCEETEEEQYKKLLNSVKKMIRINDYVFIDGEDERTTVAASNIIKKSYLDENYICEWIKSFSDYEKINKHPEDFHIKINIKNFLKSLYFSFLKEENYSYILKQIVTVLEELK